MGRFYNGDIEGKFWFAVQSSDDADFFGVTGTQPEELNYHFGEEDLKKVEEGIKTCLKELGGYKELLDNFFKDRDGYNEEMISKEFKISEEKVKELLRWYARLELGIKIRYCIKKQGDCNFTAEC